MPIPHLGEICALLAPLAWSVAVILFKRSSALPPLSMNLFKNVLAVVLLSLTLLVGGIGLPHDRPWQDWARLGVSGLLGLALADTLLFEGLRRIGAARLAVVDTVYAPTVVLLSCVFLGEQPGPAFLVGAAAVVVGVSLATIDPSAFRARVVEQAGAAEIRVGVIYATCAIVSTATGVVIAKPVLAASNLVEVTWTRLVVGVAGQLVYSVLSGRGKEAAVAFRPAAVWWTLLPGAFVGTYVSLMLWLGGFKWADASVAATLNQMATVYMLLLARIFLKERLQPRQVAGALIAACGALWIVLGRA